MWKLIREVRESFYETVSPKINMISEILFHVIHLGRRQTVDQKNY